MPASRDPFLWPFAADSIWNTPVGRDAVFVPAGLEPAGHVGVDIQHILALDPSDPERDVLESPSWGPGRCSGTASLGLTFPVPDDWIVPDAGSSPYGLTPNSNFAFLLPDGDTLFQGMVISRCAEAGPIHLPSFMAYPNNQGRESVRGDGISGGGQGASHMSALGGTLRKGELVGAAPIRHAIKLNPWAGKYCHYSPEVPGYRWPARAADSYAEMTYGGTNPSLVMGTLLAIAPDVSDEEVGVTTEPGRKLLFTLRHFGAYFTEDAAWDTWDLIVERDAEIEFEQTYGFSMSSATWRDELNKLVQALSIVDDNAPGTVGGAGARSYAAAPPFE
jgi:hypothetical protein